MREIGTLESEEQARRLADYLLTMDITTQVRPSSSGWGLWVHKEDLLPKARRELAEFRGNPEDARYRKADTAAKALRREAERKDRQHQKNTIDLRGRWDYTNPRRRPLTIALIVASAFVGVFSGLGTRPRPLLTELWIAYPRSHAEDEAMGEAAEAPLSLASVGARWENLHAIRRGAVWRLVTPIFIHYGIFHLLFNLSWLTGLAGLIEARRGTLRFALLVLSIAIIGNLSEYLFTGHILFGGMSGVVFGMIGWAWVRQSSHHDEVPYLTGNAIPLAMIYLVLCMTGGFQQIVGPVANVVHVAGLITGMLFAVGEHAADRFALGWRR